MGDLKYKIGDKVRIKSLDWYNENKDELDDVTCGNTSFILSMTKYCEKIVTISSTRPELEFYLIEEDNGMFYWSDEMIEGLVQDENNHLTETVVDTVRESNDRYRIVIDTRFDIEVDEGEYYAVRRKKEYPKTYEECRKILGCKSNHFFTNFSYNGLDIEISDYEDKIDDLLQNFRKLRYCRDAYWKIAGEEMGLGKPWEPDWKKQDKKYIISIFEDAVIYFENETYNRNVILAFPTEEMRDAFFNAFRDDIEKCKELL